MRVNQREKNGIIVVDISGSLLGNGARELHNSLKNILDTFPNDTGPRIVLNLRKVQNMDSFGLGVLVHTYTAVERRNGRMAIANLHASLLAVFYATKLTHVFDIYEDVDKATESFCQDLPTSPGAMKQAEAPSDPDVASNSPVVEKDPTPQKTAEGREETITQHNWITRRRQEAYKRRRKAKSVIPYHAHIESGKERADGLNNASKKSPIMNGRNRNFFRATEILDSKDCEPEKMELVGKLLGKLARKYKKDPKLHNAYARLFRRTDQPSFQYEALITAQKLCSIQEYHSPWTNLGVFYKDFDLFGKAERLFSMVLTDCHDNTDFLRIKEDLRECQRKRADICSRFGLTYPPTSPGDALLLDTLELLLAAGVKVKKAKCRLEDNLGLYHEIDLLCEVDILPAESVPFVIECKDWSRSISRPVVDQFRAFLDHSPYRLGMLIVSSRFTKGASTAAHKTGVLVKNISDFERDIESQFYYAIQEGERAREELRQRWEELRHHDDYSDSATRVGPPTRYQAHAAEKLLELATDAAIGAQSEVEINRHGIFIDGKTVERFTPEESPYYEQLFGPAVKAPILLLLIYRSLRHHTVRLY